MRRGQRAGEKGEEECRAGDLHDVGCLKRPLRDELKAKNVVVSELCSCLDGVLGIGCQERRCRLFCTRRAASCQRQLNASLSRQTHRNKGIDSFETESRDGKVGMAARCNRLDVSHTRLVAQPVCRSDSQVSGAGAVSGMAGLTTAAHPSQGANPAIRSNGAVSQELLPL